jgi:hypothetical protein
MKTLQKQLGDEQKRVAQMQLQMSRNDTAYQKRVEEDELALSRELAARKLGEDGHKVAKYFGGSLVPLFMICFLFFCAILFTRSP